MDNQQQDFLYELLDTRAPSGFETAGQQVWIETVSEFADDVWTDEYGNAVAVHEGTGDNEIALAGHGDEIGFIIRNITDDGFIRLSRIGGSDKTVSLGQHVKVHTKDGLVNGVIGQTAIHLREPDQDSAIDIEEQLVDIGATDREDAENTVEIGDPVTFSSTVQQLKGSRIAARGIDNRIGIWTAAEVLNHAVQENVDSTVYAVSTVQEEVGLQGAKMAGFDLNPDAVIGIDVTHASDHPESPQKSQTGVELGGGPVVSRGSANHPVLVEAIRDIASTEDLPLQLQAAGTRTSSDIDAFYTQRGGIPSAIVSLPNRYMHTPVEVIDENDLSMIANLLGVLTEKVNNYQPFTLDIDN